MKVLKVVTHPFTLLISFFMILISGEHWGGFYLLYLLLGLPHGAIHSILALIGVSLILLSNYKYKRNRFTFFEYALNISGAFLLILSLFLFFSNDRRQYNYGTFNQWIPLCTLGLFSIIAICYLGQTIFRLFSRDPGDHLSLKT